MKRLFAFAAGLSLAAMTAAPATADDSPSYSISDNVYEFFIHDNSLRSISFTDFAISSMNE